MKTLNNNKFLILIIIVMLGFAVVMGYAVINNIASLNAKNDIISQQAVSTSQKSHIKFLKKQINDYQKKIDRDNKNNLNENNAKTQIKSVLDNLCKAMTFNAKYDDMDKVKKEVLQYIPKNMLEGSFGDSCTYDDFTFNQSSRKITKLYYSDIETTTPKVIAEVDSMYRARKFVHIWECEFQYSENDGTYTIKKIRVYG